MKRLIKKASKLRTRNIILIIVGIFIAAFVIYTVIFYSIKGWQWDNIFPYLLGTGGIIEAFTGLLTLVEIIVGRKRKEKNNEV
jgi:multisubunit Na+/H+ antiporter MnhB subunit|nr:MAG TPA: PilA, PilC, PilN, PilO, PilM, pilus, ring, membrane channel [Caudoviricetes sp.]DAY80566.1 MAG TPA: PilA, PilC, PilN, PilO, PilM, pilus, ring, membrane channel [Caudoviricetes sp.]